MTNFDAPRRRPFLATNHRWLAIAALVAVLLIAIAAMWHNAPTTQAYNGGIPVASIAREGRVWVPQGPAVLWPDDQMTAIAKTKEGDQLYTRSALVGGGGGPAVKPDVPHAFLRVGNGQYQPVALVTVGL